VKPKKLKRESGDTLRYSLNEKKRGANMKDIETEAKLRKLEALVKLASSGNNYAKQELNFIRKGKRGSFEPISDKECEHVHILPNGKIISAEREIKALRGCEFNEKRREWVYFEIGGSVCSICGKKLSFKVERKYER
jgi:hypothetical protein